MPPTAADARKIKAIQNRQIRREEWHDAQEIAPHDLSEVSKTYGLTNG